MGDGMSELAVDLDYDLEEDRRFLAAKGRVNLFFFARVPEAIAETIVQGTPARVLDVGCGEARQAVAFFRRGWESWGLEPSPKMLEQARTNADRKQAGIILVRGIAERLPFKDATFDRVLCQGSLDHFADPQAFIRELSRILKPQGRAVIALANYESLSCRLGRLYAAARRFFGLRGTPPSYRYWEPPPTHTFKGDYRLVKRLGRPWLDMERCYGISLLWFFPRWKTIIDSIPYPLAWAVLRVVDRIAYRLPALADMVVSTWRPSNQRMGPVGAAYSPQDRLSVRRRRS
jgi:SAM-dependent methyltransferase